jgi:hypothetical protein
MILPAAELSDRLTAAGFLCLGDFEPGPADNVPSLSAQRPTRHLCLIGSTGPSLWPAFKTSVEFSDGADNPLDRYTTRILRDHASKFGCEVLFPFEDPPYHPFQQWALKCGGFSQSPLGVLAHHDFGPWSGFRAAFLFPEHPADLIQQSNVGPCETCTDKPCLTACPVDAISLDNGYNVPSCRSHLAGSQALDCWSGCLARRACPFGSEHAPEPDNARFHMQSFVQL